MTLSSPLRLDEQLVTHAKQKGRLYKRNARNQIEYWAELGRSVEKYLDPESIIAINEGILDIKLTPRKTTPVSPDVVFQAVDKKVRSGEVLAKVSEHTPVYQASKSIIGALEKRLEDGSFQVGKFIDGEFVPLI